MEERLFAEDLKGKRQTRSHSAIVRKGGDVWQSHHACKHASQTPHVERVIILLKVNEQFWAFEISRRYTDVVFRVGMVELGETPVDEAELK